MKKLFSVLCCFLLLCTVMSVSVFAHPDRLVDDADLLTDEEESDIRARLDEVSETYQVDVVIVTTDSTYGASPMEYADDFFDYNGYGFGTSYDGVLLLISMEDRDWWISTTGLGIRALDDSTIEYIGEWMLDDLSNGWYADAFETFIDECEYYINGEINGFPFDFGSTLMMSVVIGLIAAFIATAVMKSKLKSVRRQTAASDYVKANSLQLTQSQEIYLYRNVVAVKRASESSGSSSTHRSSSGRSHGGGGGKF